MQRRATECFFIGIDQKKKKLGIVKDHASWIEKGLMSSLINTTLSSIESQLEEMQGNLGFECFFPDLS